VQHARTCRVGHQHLLTPQAAGRKCGIPIGPGSDNAGLSRTGVGPATMNPFVGAEG
jgi:hypothetical protein